MQIAKNDPYAGIWLHGVYGKEIKRVIKEGSISTKNLCTRKEFLKYQPAEGSTSHYLADL